LSPVDATKRKKLVLVVIDAMKPAMLERAIADGRAPALQRIRDNGVYIDECAAPFPSVTPVCAATITTGVGPAEHRIPGMNWYHREEQRYVEYGTSFSASRQAGVIRSLTDTVYRLNSEHLNAEVKTVFESLDDLPDVRTDGTTYLIYRGRHPHEVAQESTLARIVTSTLFKRTVDGPRELFYADIYASRKTGCRSQLGLPGIRDQHTGCVGTYLLEHDLFDFMLFSLPDNDAWSHKHGPAAQVVSIAAADRQLERLMHAGGGPEQFLTDHAVIVCSDHSQAMVEERIAWAPAFEKFDVAPAGTSGPGEGAELAVCPSSRAMAVYVLDAERRARLLPRAAKVVEGLDGVDLTMFRTTGGEAVIRSPRGELRFAPGGWLVDLRGEHWSVEGSLEALEARIEDGRFLAPDYPDALTRVWSALTCETSGDVLASAAPGYEFVDWGGVDHVGGGSHGSLHASDSNAALLYCGTGPSSREGREQWSLRDVAPLVRAHFGATS